MRATWNGAVIAQSDQTVVVEDSHYFPPDSVNTEYLKRSDLATTCPWKGRTEYFDVVVDGQVNPDAAWSVPAPKPAAREIARYVAFWRGVTIEP